MIARPVTRILVWCAAFVLSLSTYQLTNDHFGRISPGWQIVTFRELPFRDFFDPGYFMAELSSAAFVRFFGAQLLGEMLLNASCIATGALLVFMLARRVAGSYFIAQSAALFTVLAMPRAYDYDKCLFYPLGVLLCWRYVDRPTVPRLAALAAGIVAAASFRYDNGVFIACAGMVAVLAVHAGDWTLSLKRVGVLAAAVAAAGLPFVLFVELNGGVADAIDQMHTYARRESARTRISGAPPFLLADLRANAPAVLYVFFRLLPLGAAIALLIRALRGRAPAARETAQLASLITLCVLLNVFILRDPVAARAGGIAGPTAILAAWVAGCLVRRRAPDSTLRARPGGIGTRIASLAAGVVLALVAASVVAGLGRSRHLSRALTPSGLAAEIGALAAAPPALDLLPNGNLRGLVGYVRDCTGPDDRVFASWFVPELYFFAERGFAGRIVATFGGHWSEPRFERRTISSLGSQSVPIVLLDLAGAAQFRADYPLLARFLGEHYREAGETRFGNEEAGFPGYAVLVRRDRLPVRTHHAWSMPCFA